MNIKAGTKSLKFLDAIIDLFLTYHFLTSHLNAVFPDFVWAEDIV